jgi:hypothetical protein
MIKLNKEVPQEFTRRGLSMNEGIARLANSVIQRVTAIAYRESCWIIAKAFKPCQWGPTWMRHIRLRAEVQDCS